MLREHLRKLIAAAMFGAVLQGPQAWADDALTYWLNATSDPAVTVADFITPDPFAPDARPVAFVDPFQPYEYVGGGLPDVDITVPGTETPGLASTQETTTAAVAADRTIDSGTLTVQQPTDAGMAIQQDNTATGANVQRKSSFAFEPRVRSYGVGRLYTQGDGAYYYPVRPDLHTSLSLTDPSLIEGIHIIRGPYSVQYGPGLAFIDVVTAETPRYYDCPETHARTGYTYNVNGKRHYARETVFGGGADYGYIFNYGYRNGADYEAGGDQSFQYPGSYKAHNVMGQFGFNLASESRVEMRYQRLDQSDTQYPGQFFEVDQLQSDIYNAWFVDEDCCSPWTRLYVGGWFYRTPMLGHAGNFPGFRQTNEPAFNVIRRIEAALDDALDDSLGNDGVNFSGLTQGRVLSSGGRAIATFGEKDFLRLHTGVDLRYVKQNILERYRVDDNVGNPIPVGPPDPSLDPFFSITGLPESELTNPGVFTELELPMTEYWRARVGGRVDYVYTNAFFSGPLANFVPQLPGGDQDLKQGDVLYAYYIMNDIELNSVWTASAGFGHGQRPPTLLERYADGVFVSAIQSGFSRIIGNQYLQEERSYQFDAALTGTGDYARGQLSGFYAIIDDYVTFRAAPVRDPTGAYLLRYINSRQATIMGGEAYGELDVDTYWTLFAAAQYVRGTDDEVHAPLPGMPPLDTRVGVRLHDAEGGRYWGVTWTTRMVDAQDRLGLLRIGGTEDTGIETLETRTPGFFTMDLRAYWNARPNLTLVGGIENFTDTKYLEHLDLRLPRQDVGGFGPAYAFAPGFSPYMGLEWTY